MSEWVQPADGRQPRASLLHAPQRIKGGGCEEHGKNDEVHHSREILELLDERRQQHAERAKHQARQRERRQNCEIAPPGRWLDLPEISDDKKRIDLQNRNGDARDQLRRQEKPTRRRTDQQHAHAAHFAIVDHRQRRLHAVEELDHRDQSRRDIDFVENVRVIGRHDRDAERLSKSGCENEQPDQRAHQCGNEALALVEKTQALSPNDAVEADQALRPAERPVALKDGVAHHSPPSLPSPVKDVNASPIERAFASSITERDGPFARTRPLCNTTTWSSSRISSTRWVAQRTPIPSSATRARTTPRMPARALMSSPAVGSSSSNMRGRCRRARAIS